MLLVKWLNMLERVFLCSHVGFYLISCQRCCQLLVWFLQLLIPCLIYLPLYPLLGSAYGETALVVPLESDYASAHTRHCEVQNCRDRLHLVKVAFCWHEIHALNKVS